MWRKQADAQPSPVATEPPSPYSPGTSPALERAPAAIPSVSSEATRLTQGISVKGEFKGEGDMYIDGEVEGKIRLGKSVVTVGPNGRVSADIEAREILVQGVVQGKLQGSDRVVLGRSSRVNGDVTTQHIVIEDGAQFRGQVEMTSSGGLRPSSAAADVDRKEGIQ